MSANQASLRPRAIQPLPALFEQVDVAKRFSAAAIAQRQFALKPQPAADYGDADDTVEAKLSRNIDLHDIQGDIFPSFPYVSMLRFNFS